MTCRGICIRPKASSRYATGHKRCQTCDMFIKWDGVFCPCCGSRLRIGPRNIKSNAKLRKQKRIEEANKLVNNMTQFQILKI
jgi:rRNA maturation endonuclease Nob1